MNSRQTPRRTSVTIRLSPSGLELIDEWATTETGGNRSEMMRRLFTEAVQARQTLTIGQASIDGKG